jgi:hypothetical protein
MRFKILRGTETFTKLTRLRLRINECNDAAGKLVKELGGERYLHHSGLYTIAGGIAGIELKERPEGWGLAYPKTYSNIYFPIRNRIANKEILERINSLPLVEDSDLNNILGYEPQDVHKSGLRYTLAYRPAIHFRDEYMLIRITDGAVYTPINADIIEITVSEFNSLEKESEVVNA